MSNSRAGQEELRRGGWVCGWVGLFVVCEGKFWLGFVTLTWRESVSGKKKLKSYGNCGLIIYWRRCCYCYSRMKRGRPCGDMQIMDNETTTLASPKGVIGRRGRPKRWNENVAEARQDGRNSSGGEVEVREWQACLVTLGVRPALTCVLRLPTQGSGQDPASALSFPIAAALLCEGEDEVCGEEKEEGVGTVYQPVVFMSLLLGKWRWCLEGGGNRRGNPTVKLCKGILLNHLKFSFRFSYLLSGMHIFYTP